ncbi:chaperone protein DnaJ [Clostridia bacterium]|nr:chaperone protein DnaJ [Clostridia bacterium]GHV13532.1 chaperone protein DnaJ [Clostridia bacterium]
MADSKRDFYEVLGVPKNAAEADIKKSYRTLAKKYHPDVNPGDKTAEKNFKEINEAYEVLSDTDKRQRYDNYGHAGIDPQAGGDPFSGFGGGNGGGFQNFGFDDILSTFFGGGGASTTERRNMPRRGDDVYQRVTLSFEEAVFGCSKDIAFSHIVSCADCGGSGAAKGSSVSTCSVCGGTGVLKTRRRTPLGYMESTKGCESCGGTGKIIKNPCPSCSGNGLTRENAKKSVEIPAGIDDNQKIAVRGFGNSGVNGGQSGDLIITISVRPHAVFEREGYNVYCEIPVTFVEASLGADIDVPTLEGKDKYKIPEGTQTGTVFTLKNRGIQHINNPKSRGDLMFKVTVEVPTGLSDKQKAALREFGDSLAGKNHAKKESFFAKFRKGFGG